MNYNWELFIIGSEILKLYIYNNKLKHSWNINDSVFLPICFNYRQERYINVINYSFTQSCINLKLSLVQSINSETMFSLFLWIWHAISNIPKCYITTNVNLFPTWTLNEYFPGHLICKLILHPCTKSWIFTFSMI